MRPGNHAYSSETLNEAKDKVINSPCRREPQSITSIAARQRERGLFFTELRSAGLQNN